MIADLLIFTYIMHKANKIVRVDSGTVIVEKIVVEEFFFFFLLHDDGSELF